MLVDLDYFFAQCEGLRNPEIKKRPVVVGMYSGRTEDSGAVSTSNYIARKFGVKSGIALYLAKKRLEGADAVFLPVDYDYYQQISDKIMKILRSYSDIFEQVGIDEAYLDVTKKTGADFERATVLAHKMKEDVKRNLGVTFSVGIGTNKIVAKIASNERKPDGVTVVRPNETTSFLSPLPVDSLLGVGKKTAKKMNDVGITTVGELAQFDIQRLVGIFGKTLAVYFHNSANGLDQEPVKEAGEAESISRISTLKEDSRDLVFIIEKIDQQIEELYKELTQKNLKYRQVGIIAVMTDLSAKSRIQTLEKPEQDIDTIRRIARNLLDRFLAESEMKIRRIGIKVSGFTQEEDQQQPLTRFF